ncbi:hypothetical protein TTHERM_00289230 (macronuclear) [Tetrahymena thermophila SB210]|uniref:Transcription factor Iwr1 domain-containing protein n=1 Tax=Tetrahymena thermophila (strain SB210) TaxID=312017 RepID=I7LVK3_TETTS|nr:hypothetical protein TTHERM_00289230 [Tetrahymena thermophila SB210]EAR98395.3 hypothetical protein TTHERM_00289230 [Tetrahymena thermophila SB210]|eukprot:XP_001018640.3 hypothetical protein TTHERM_00289230 [Tetrahymena thermophila SB210]
MDTINKQQEIQTQQKQENSANDAKAQPQTTLVVRMKRKANEDPLEKLIIEGQFTQKKQKPNPLFGVNFLEKMLNDLSIQNDDQKKENEQEKQKQNLLFNDQEEEKVEKKQYILKLVDNEAVQQIKEVKMMQAENLRKKARDRKLQAHRKHRILEMVVDPTSKEVIVEKTNLKDEKHVNDEEYAYYEVEERKIEEDNSFQQDDGPQNIGSLLQKEQENILKVQSGIIHFVQTNNSELFDGEFAPCRSDDFSDKDSEDSNRESADQNDYPDEEENFDDEDNDYDKQNQDEDYDSYDEDNLKFKKKSKKKPNMFQDSLHGIYLAKQSSDDNSNSMDQEDKENDEDYDYEDEFTKKYNNYHHKRYENDFEDDDYED